MSVKLSEIASLLTDAAETSSFRILNAGNFAERRPLLEKHGSVVPVRVTEDADIELSVRDVAKLCSHFIAGNLDAVELAYVADVLQLSDRVSWADEDVSGYVAEFTDPEINGPFTIERAQAIVREIDHTYSGHG